MGHLSKHTVPRETWSTSRNTMCQSMGQHPQHRAPSEIQVPFVTQRGLTKQKGPPESKQRQPKHNMPRDATTSDHTVRTVLSEARDDIQLRPSGPNTRATSMQSHEWTAPGHAILFSLSAQRPIQIKRATKIQRELGGWQARRTYQKKHG